LIEKLRAETQQPLIVVDAGNLLFKNALSGTDATNTTALIAAHGIVRAYQAMAYDAVAPSSNDLSAGPAFFRQSSDLSFPWVSANLYDQNANLFFPPHIIKKAGGLTVGIIGLTGSDGNSIEGFVVGDWRKALETELNVLEKSCDIFVVLSNLDVLENNEIQSNFSKIDIIVAADKRAANLNPTMSHNSLLVQSGARGKYLGKLDITGHGEGNWLSASSQSPDQRKMKLDSIDRQLSKLSQLEKQQSNTVQDVSQKIARLRSYRQIISDQLEQQSAESGKGETQPSKSFKSSFLPVNPAISKGDVGAIVLDIKGSINAFNRYRRAGLQADDAVLRVALQKDEIVGTTSCFSCHEEQTKFWKKTRHANAYTTLSLQGQSFNLQCLPCHVTSGNVRASSNESELLFLLSLDIDRQTIGCEVCHGPGNDHLTSPGQGTLVRLPPEEICTQCHTPDRDNNFDYPEKLAAIACPAN
jgi:hypothetical protein